MMKRLCYAFRATPWLFITVCCRARYVGNLKDKPISPKPKPADGRFCGFFGMNSSLSSSRMRVRFVGGENFTIVTLGGDPRGDILSIFAARLGASPYGVDMQGNPMAAGRSVLRIIEAMKGGKDSFLAPDGPDGPAFTPKPGASFLARKAEAAVIPVGGLTNAGYALRRWDKYLVPFPFSRLHMVFGDPIFVNKRDKEATVTERIVAGLTAVYDQAPWPVIKQTVADYQSTVLTVP